jgi:hypothetical protein
MLSFGDMFFEPDDDGISKERALAIFEDVVQVGCGHVCGHVHCKGEGLG